MNKILFVIWFVAVLYVTAWATWNTAFRECKDLPGFWTVPARCIK